MRPLPEDFQDQSGTVYDFRVPGLFQVALLHWRERSIDEDEPRFMRAHDAGEFLHFSLAEVGGRANGGKRNAARVCDRKIDRAREADRLLDLRLDAARRDFALNGFAGRFAIEKRHDDNRPRKRAGKRWRLRPAPLAGAPIERLQSDFVHCSGDILGLEQLHGMAWHDRRDRVLVDELGMPVTPQQYAEIVERGHDALQLHAVHEKNRERDLGLANMIEKGVLQILGTFRRHCRFPSC